MTESLDTAHRHWDDRWRSESGRAPWLTPDPWVAATIPLLRQRGVRRVLDLGCGIGRHALLLAREGLETHGLDASPGGLAAAREAAEAEGLTVGLREAPMTSLPYDDGSLDYVLAFKVIYHGDSAVARRTFAEIRRVLRPGGLLQATMLSRRHHLYGRGRQIAPDTFVIDGEVDDDKAHPHLYVDARGLLALAEGFEPLELVEREATRPGSREWLLLAERV
jgi:tellurite methyltransferase